MVDTVLRNAVKETNEALARIEALLTRLCDGLESGRMEREAVAVVDAGHLDRVRARQALRRRNAAEAEAEDLRNRIRFFKGALESVYPDALIQRASFEAQIESLEARLRELEGSGANDEHQ